ncbi:MAG: amino acid permease [Bacteroidales bacterium]|nr:amino acid permease [Bacteroidales bacterium]
MAWSEFFRKKRIDSSTLEEEKLSLRRVLGVGDLTALGISAIIGAGIFSTIGTAASYAGPSVAFLFVLTAIACGFSAMAYAQFASAIPLSGSAYTYAYVAFGEIVAWIIGWDLIMEYSIGNIAVAISWSDYFTAFLEGFGIHIPPYFSIDYVSAHRGYEKALISLQTGQILTPTLQEAYEAYVTAPQIAGIRLIGDLPAFFIVATLTVLILIGIRETKLTNNVIVVLKILILLVVISVGIFYVDSSRWRPFFPNGVEGMLSGVAGVFFAYIGFDAITTTAEECRNPGKDLPRGIFFSLFITTILYVTIALVLTGIVPYHELAVGDPMAYVFSSLGLAKFSGVLAFSAVIAMLGVLLVFQVGQTRIWMNMSRDGLLPPFFSRIHPRFKTPYVSTIIAGIFVAVPTLFTNLEEMTELTSIGTIFAFVLVTGGVMLLDRKKKEMFSSFRMPYIDSRFIAPLFIVVLDALFFYFFDFSENWFYTVLLIIFNVLLILSIVYRWSFLLLVGLMLNIFMLSTLSETSWLRFLLWLAIGLMLYFFYARKHSKLNKKQDEIATKKNN